MAVRSFTCKRVTPFHARAFKHNARAFWIKQIGSASIKNLITYFDFRWMTLAGAYPANEIRSLRTTEIEANQVSLPNISINWITRLICLIRHFEYWQQILTQAGTTSSILCALQIIEIKYAFHCWNSDISVWFACDKLQRWGSSSRLWQSALTDFHENVWMAALFCISCKCFNYTKILYG